MFIVKVLYRVVADCYDWWSTVITASPIVMSESPITYTCKTRSHCDSHDSEERTQRLVQIKIY